MELLRKQPAATTWLTLVALAIVLIMVPQVSARRVVIGGGVGWSPMGGNFTEWAAKQHFYYGDWLFFVYDRNQQDVLEVNKTDFESCNAAHPLHNFTTGAGRDVVQLNVSHVRYFLSSKGSCYGGMKFPVHVEHHPPPPKGAPSKSSAVRNLYRSQFVLPLAFAIGAVWDSLLRAI